MSGVLRPKFPGRVFQTRSSTGTRRRLRTAVLELGTDTTRVGENVARGIRAFYTMLGSESDDEVRFPELNNFTMLSPCPDGAVSRVCGW